jgi:hypothetical protein
MLNNILTLNSLEAEARQIDDFLNITNSEDINECVFRGNELVVCLARSGKMLADIGWWRDEAIVKATDECDNDLPPSIMAKYIAAKCQRENYLFTWIDRLNRTCVHQIDWIRTMVSKAKVEMQYQNG